MKNLRKCSLAFALLFSCSVVVQSLVPFQHDTNTVDTATRSVVSATETINIATRYFYNQLSKSAIAQKFYNALAAMEKEGLFKEGIAEYDLIENDVLTEAEVMNYINNANSTILVAFSAARDAFILDNPSLFYVNADNLGVTIGTKGGKAYATLGTGRDNSYCITTEWNKSKVENAIVEYEKKVKEIAENAKASGETPSDMIAYVNDWLCKNVEYSFCDSDGKVFSDLRGTAYGSLINGKGVCESFARGFKAVMDELEIPCVLVYGNCNMGENYEPHMWNYVQLDGKWYDIDTTWNNTSKKSQRYYLKGAVDFSRDHTPSGILSDFEFSYPKLSDYQYGVSAADGGFVFNPKYETYNDITELKLEFSYNGKSVSKLHEEGIYVAFRHITRKTTVQDMVFTPWCSAYEANEVYTIWYEEEDTKDALTTFPLHPGIESIQFMLVTKAPNDSNGAVISGEPYYHYYKGEFDSEEIIQVSDCYTNDAYGTYIPSPGVTAATPMSTTALNATGEFIDCKLTFSDDLVRTDEWVDKNDYGTISSESAKEISKNSSTTDISIEVLGVHSDINEYIKVEDVTWDPSNPKVVSFRFKASQQFKHAYETYAFYVHGLVGSISGKEPDAYSLSFAKRYVICPKVFNDGRDYIVCYGEPQIVANQDLSTSGWTADNGTVFSANQRSQMMLVVNDIDSADEKDTMLDAAAKKDKTDQNNILASATYEIDLQICRQYTKIPKGSYLQVSIGFPEGMKYEDFANGNKTLKMYHYKRNANGEIDPSLTEEISLAVTPYGLIAKITDFSPFAVVVYDGKNVATPKRISASVLGKGGTISGSEITTFENNEITYTLIPKEGYQLDKVLVNNKMINLSNESEGNEIAGVKVGVDEKGDTTLTFNKEEIKSVNTLVQVSFVANRVIEYEKEQTIIPVQKTLILEKIEGVTEFVPIIPDESLTPDEPSTPEVPDKPSTPDTPATPSTPSTGNGNTGSGSGSTQITKPIESENTQKPETITEGSIEIPSTSEVLPIEPEKPDTVKPAPSTQVFNNTKKPSLNVKVKKGSKKVSFKWNKIDGADGYKIYQYNPNTGKYKCIKTIKDSTTTFSKKMQRASAYSFKIRAFTTADDGSKIYGKYSTVMKVTTPPNMVKGLKVNSAGSKVTLSWKEVKNADGYQIFYSKKKNGTYSRIKTVKKSSLDTVIKQTGNKTYYYKVRAFVKDTDNNRVCGNYSKIVSTKS